MTEVVRAAPRPGHRCPLAYRYGLATRISVTPSASALYATQLGPLSVEAIAIDFDAEAWTARFLTQWPEGSDAHASYFSRMAETSIRFAA